MNNNLQLLRVNNELVEKDELIAKFKGQEVLYEQKLVEKDNIYKQDAMVRLQMGKRLEQVLMDKEDALEQLELLKVRALNPNAFEHKHCSYFLFLKSSVSYVIDATRKYQVICEVNYFVS